MEIEKQSEAIKRSDFQPKSYRLNLPFYLAFEACVSVYGIDKSKLMLSMINANKKIDTNKIKELPEYNQNRLAEGMLDDLKELQRPIQDLIIIKSDPKMAELVKYANKQLGTQNEKPLKPLRILPSYQEFVSNFSGPKPLGDTIELAIALFINETNDYEYELIKTVFQNLVMKQKEAPGPRNEVKFKTYRFNAIFQLLLDVCIQLHANHNKREVFVDQINDKQITLSKIKQFPEYDQTELVEMLLDNLKSVASSVDEILNVMNEPRVVLIKDYSQKKLDNQNKRERKNIKLSEEHQEFTKEFSKKVGDAIEYSLALYISKMEEEEFKLLERVFKRYVDIKSKGSSNS